MWTLNVCMDLFIILVWNVWCGFFLILRWGGNLAMVEWGGDIINSIEDLIAFKRSAFVKKTYPVKLVVLGGRKFNFSC